MTDEKRSRRARRKAHEKLLGEAAAATRTWQLFGEAMRFAHAHAPEGADVFNLLRFGNSPDGTLLDAFCTLHPGLTDEDRHRAQGFRFAFSSLFFLEQVLGSALVMTDLVTGRQHQVVAPRAELAKHAVERSFVATILVPTGHDWILGGLMRPVKHGVTDEQVLQTARRIALVEADRVRAANPGITQHMIRELHEAFVAWFEADHVVGPPEAVVARMQEFHADWNPGVHDGYVSTGRLEADADLVAHGSVGLIADPSWGYVLVPGLDRLLIAVRTGDTPQIEAWLRDGSHPAAFRCAWRNHPMETQAALQRIFPHPDWSQRAEIVLQRAKSQWTPIRPSVLPLPVELANVSPGPSEVPPDGIGLVSLLVG